MQVQQSREYVTRNLPPHQKILDVAQIEWSLNVLAYEGKEVASVGPRQDQRLGEFGFATHDHARRREQVRMLECGVDKAFKDLVAAQFRRRGSGDGSFLEFEHNRAVIFCVGRVNGFV